MPLFDLGKIFLHYIARTTNDSRHFFHNPFAHETHERHEGGAGLVIVRKPINII